MLSRIVDQTAAFNQNNKFVMDVSGWQTMSVHFTAPTGTIEIEGSNDSGAVEGVSDGNAITSEIGTYEDIEATLLADGSQVTTVAAAGIYKIDIACKYVRFGGAAAAAAKVIVFLNTPN